MNRIVEVPAASEDPTPDESQLPPTVQEPLVRDIAPEVPPVIVTFETLTEDPFAVRVPPFPTVNEPPVRLRLLVANVVPAAL